MAERRMRKQFRVGTGYDIHRLVVGRKLILGGMEIPFEKGLLGHSDADALTHAICDALLGAAALGDIGRHFPDNDATFAGISSLRLLEKVKELLHKAGYRIGNIDVTVHAERPKLSKWIDLMRRQLATTLGEEIENISIKAKTNEGLDVVGRGEAIVVSVVVLIYYD